MRLSLSILILISCTLRPAAAQLQPTPFSSRLERQFQRQMVSGFMLPDSHAAVTPRSATSIASGSLLRGGARSVSYFSLTAQPLRFYGLERYELSSFECALQGLDEGLTMGLFVGALGTSTGLFEENSAWYIAGAMTALGAFLGLRSGVKDPTSRIRYRWEEE